MFLSPVDFFEKLWNTIKVSNSLYPDKGQRFVEPDLDPNCLQKLSAGKS